MKLSILICSCENRKPLLQRMLRHLRHQDGDMEILTCLNTDVMQRGVDRNSLIDNAAGEYCCFVDDDDVVSDDYVFKILRATEKKPDVCAITGVVTSLIDNQTHKFNLSSRHEELFALPSTDLEDDTYKRFLSHLNPIRTEIAREVRFPDEPLLHEDNGYSERLKEYKDDWNEVEIEGVLYYYFNKAKIRK